MKAPFCRSSAKGAFVSATYFFMIGSIPTKPAHFLGTQKQDKD